MGGATPNVALGRAMAEAEMTNNGLARRVRDLAARRGVRSSADHVAVKRWLDGTQPKAETALLIATCLSEKLGRTLTPHGLGFTAVVIGADAPATPVEPVVYPDDADTATDRLDSVAVADTAGILVPGPHAWDGFATPSIITGYLFDDRSEYRRPNTDDAPVDAEAIRLTTARLMELDFQLGGGHTRELLLFYFRSQVLPLLRSLPRGAGRADILSATSELAQMLGWSAYDAGRHAAAQRYLTYGLRLARDAGDVLLGARLLANLSHQANYLGRSRDAVQLSRAAITTSTGIPAPPPSRCCTRWRRGPSPRSPTDPAPSAPSDAPRRRCTRAATPTRHGSATSTPPSWRARPHTASAISAEARRPATTPAWQSPPTRPRPGPGRSSTWSPRSGHCRRDRSTKPSRRRAQRSSWPGRCNPAGTSAMSPTLFNRYPRRTPANGTLQSLRS